MAQLQELEALERLERPGAPAVEPEVVPEVRPRRRWHGVRVLRRWLALRYGPIAPHGVTLVGLYALFVGLARLLTFGRVEQSLALLIAMGVVAAIFLLMVALFAWAYWSALRDTAARAAAAGAPASWLRQILLFTLLAGLVLLLLPRLFSKDVFSYMLYGLAFGVYGLNPYTTLPVNVQFDYAFRLIDWHYAGSVYGPVWTLLCTALYKLVAPFTTTHIWGHITAFRLLALAFHLGNVALVWDILGRLRPGKPGDRVAGTIFYAWNPLVLIEFAGNGHNDVALIFFLLAAIAAHLRGRPVLVALALALSVLTKFITLLIVPAYLLLLWRRAPTARERWRAWLRAGMVGLGAFAVLWAPFYEALRHPLFLVSSSAASAYENSLLEVLYWSLRHLLEVALPPGRGDQLAGLLVLTVGRIAFVLLWAWLTWQVRDVAGWLRASFWIFFAYLVLGTPWFWPWYVTWLVALAPLVGTRRATTVGLTFSASVLGLYLLWGNYLPLDRASVYPVHNVVVFGAPLLVLWLQLRRRGVATEGLWAPQVPQTAGAADRAPKSPAPTSPGVR